MNTLTKLAFSSIALALASGTAASQDYNDWSTMTSLGLEMQDEFGNIHYVDPFAYDSQVDLYGNVYSNDYYQMQPTPGMYDLTPSNQPTAYSWSEYDSTAYTMTESDNWAKGGLYDTSWMFE